MHSSLPSTCCYFSGNDATSQWGLGLHFSDDLSRRVLSVHLLTNCVSSLKKCIFMFYTILTWQFDLCCWIVWFLIYLYISPLSKTWFANVFFQCLGCPFILLIISFFTEIFTLIQSHVPNFAFGFIAKSRLTSQHLSCFIDLSLLFLKSTLDKALVGCARQRRFAAQTRGRKWVNCTQITAENVRDTSTQGSKVRPSSGQETRTLH